MVEPVRADIVFRGAYIITMDERRQVFRDGYLAVQGKRIVAVGPDQECNVIAPRTVDARGKLLMPGLVDAHNHLNQVLFRAKQDDQPAAGGMADFIGRMIRMFEGAGEELSYRILRLHLLDKIKGGTTATHDQHFTNRPLDNIDGVLRALDESGMRAFVSRCHLSHPTNVPVKAHETVDQVLAEVARLRGRWNSDRIQVTASPINPSWVATGEELVALREGVRALGAPFDIDLSGALWRQTMAERGYPGGAVEYCDSLGILDDQTLGGKSFLMLPDEYRIWGLRGVKSCLVPMGRLHEELGVALHHFLANGVVPAIGTDAPMSHPTTSIWEVMRLTWLATDTRQIAERREGNTTDHQYRPSAELILEMATIAGARALFLDPSVDGLASGRAADFIVVDIQRPAFYPTVDGRRLITSLVWCAEASMVDTVVVNGKILIEHGRSTVWDEDKVLAEAEDAARLLYERAGELGSLPKRGAGEERNGWHFI